VLCADAVVTACFLPLPPVSQVVQAGHQTRCCILAPQHLQLYLVRTPWWRAALLWWHCLALTRKSSIGRYENGQSDGWGGGCFAFVGGGEAGLGAGGGWCP
jgi:hypothetical protein